MATQSGGAARSKVRSGTSAAHWPATIRGHVRIWIAAVIGAIVVGTLGYVLLVGWSLEDGLYMTVTTMTTVGYNEVHPLGTVGRIWTMIVSIGGVVVIFGSIGIVAESVLSEVASGRREQRRMHDAVGALKNHFLLCGYGRVGATVAREFQHASIPFVIVDINPASLETALTDGYLVVEGDATRDEVLRQAGIDRARGLITTIDSDANNVYVTLSARAINPELFIVARANYVGAESKVLQAGANRVVSPYTRAGRQIAELATRPRVADFIDYALSHGQLAFSMEEVEVAADGPLVGRTVGSLVEDGIHLMAIVRGPRDYEPNPPLDRVLVVGDGLIVSGASDTLRRLRERA